MISNIKRSIRFLSHTASIKIQIVFQAFAALIFLQITMRLCKISAHLPPLHAPTPHPSTRQSLGSCWCWVSGVNRPFIRDAESVANSHKIYCHASHSTWYTECHNATVPQCHRLPQSHILLDTQSATDCHTTATFYMIHRQCHSAGALHKN